MTARVKVWLQYTELWLLVGWVVVLKLRELCGGETGTEFLASWLWRAPWWAVLLLALQSGGSERSPSRPAWREHSAGAGLAAALVLVHGATWALLQSLLADPPLSGFLDFLRSELRSESWRDLVFVGAAVIAQSAVAAWRDYQQTKAHLRHADLLLRHRELASLGEQLSPHLLVNSLSTARLLIADGRPEEAKQMLGDLSHLLRVSLESADLPLATLREEVEFARSYLAMQGCRLSPPPELHVDLPAGCETVRVPRLLLQPLVENSLLHGFAHWRETRAPRLEIRARRTSGKIVVEVEDNGRGGPAGLPLSVRGRGIGLGNTRRRLEKLFGEGYQLVVRRRTGRGTVVEITLPTEES